MTNNIKTKKLIIKPVLSEKSIKLADTQNIYTLVVSTTGNKIELKKEIELKFNVKVTDLRTVTNLGKKTKFGKKRIQGKRSDYKKALVRLKKGDKLSFFEVK